MTRREALKNLSYLLWIPFAWIIIKLNERHNLLKGGHAVVRIPAAIPEGFSFYGTVIVSKTANKIQFLSSRCTHLGCRITQEEQGILNCPCHGSAYDRNGKIISGPAVRSLENLSWRVDEKTGDFLVRITES